MTRKEFTGTRDLTFSGWIRDKLPDSNTGFVASDLDFVLWNWKTRKLMLLEVKTRSATMRKWQSMLFDMLDRLILYGSERIRPPIEYYGFHCIRFENTDFTNGRCMFDRKIVSEEELINILSMKQRNEALDNDKRL